LDQVNAFDAIVIVLVAAAVIIGIGSGALPQICGLVGAFAGGVIAVFALPSLQPLLLKLEPGMRAIAVLVGILLIVALGETVGSALGRATAVRLRGPLGTIDRVFGGLVAAAQALLVVWLIGGLLAAGPMRGIAAQAQTSLVVRGLDRILPAPTEMATALGRLLDDTDLPNLFVGLEPLPAPPVDRPTDPAAEAIARVAEMSTVKVTAATCEFLSSGSGFAIAPEYVVTNAHVIAGGRSIRVASADRGPLDAVVVLDDPDLDVALLWVPDLRAAPLRLAVDDPVRGDLGATLGFPHGGGLDVEPAAVAGRYIAPGRDIYGDQRVSRSILELRADVEQGDSGGPLVLADGTVGGVVFAQARTDASVGYALTPTSVARTVEPSIGRTTAVDPGDCIH
jgi:S1-C subfamily serine protease